MLNILNNAYVPARMQAILDIVRRTYKSDYPVNVEIKGDAMCFIDSRCPVTSSGQPLEHIGYVQYDTAKDTYLIQSFRIEVRGRKPRRGSARVRNYKRSKSVKNAAKLVMEYFQPYTTRDLARIVGGNPRSEMYQWALEKGEELSELMDHIPRSQILEEVMYLKTQGAQFKTEVFRAIAEKGVELKEEQMRRQRERDNTFRVFVTTEPDGRMACHAIAPTEDTKFAFQASFAFTSEQEMPDVMQDKMAMLRFADNTVFLPEVGKRVNTSFWLLLTPEEMQACTAS